MPGNRWASSRSLQDRQGTGSNDGSPCGTLPPYHTRRQLLYGLFCLQASECFAWGSGGDCVRSELAAGPFGVWLLLHARISPGVTTESLCVCPSLGSGGTLQSSSPGCLWVPSHDSKPDEIRKAPNAVTHSPAGDTISGSGAGLSGR